MLPTQTEKFLFQDPRRKAGVLSQLDRKGANIGCKPITPFILCIIPISPKEKRKLGDVSDVPRAKDNITPSPGTPALEEQVTISLVLKKEQNVQCYSPRLRVHGVILPGLRWCPQGRFTTH